jgi:DNA-binding NtrC family response regulator
MPGMQGDLLLKEIKASNPGLPVILMTAYGKIRNAVAAMQNGAVDYLEKPVDGEQLEIKIRSALEKRRLVLEISYLREVAQGGKYEALVGDSSPMRGVYELIERVSKSDSTVLILGESGTGKELVARAIHNRSHRSKNPFVPINCVAIPEELLESELFGHVRGSFTGAMENRVGRFELADGGTLFLDEIGDMSPRLQGKILRAIQEKTIEPVGGKGSRRVDVRIIAATHVDLESRVREKRFREDLYYRLNVVPLRLPPLRERKGDIPILVKHFLLKHGNGTMPFIVGPDILESIERYTWPGNVRELENLVERAVVLGTPEVLRLKELKFQEYQPKERSRTPSLPSPDLLASLSYRQAKEKVLNSLDRILITSALRRTGGNVTRAAEELGMHRKNLHIKMAELDIDPKAVAETESGEGQNGSMDGGFGRGVE